VRKGTLIAFAPSAGTRVRRPASIRIVVSTGYPRAIVPDVAGADLASARTRLAGAQLRYSVAYRLAPSLPANEVLNQTPASGTSVYQGTEIRLTVARLPHWVKLISAAGSGPYESEPFTVPTRWQIRYRVTGGEFGIAVAQFTWAPVGSLFGGNGFVAHRPGGVHTYAAADGAGSYRLVVNPFAGTGWYVEVDALK
jgi:hypothetical protein